ncbi:MAG: kinase [Verrucomicrobia bacterium]|nr:kinase [Verrucomicrobiota bacterium]
MKKRADKISRVGLIANTDKTACRSVVRQAVRAIEASGRTVMMETATQQFMGREAGPRMSVSALARAVDLVVVFGGDGTMLSVARDLHGVQTPVLGINVGSLGFLTAVSSKNVKEAFARVWAGEFDSDPRWLIEAHGEIEGKEFVQCALNDFVISRGAASRMIELEVRVDEEMLTRYRCDGLILSSSTGSTAYSLSAGGAIVSPSAEVFTLTPICPHTLSNRSVILSLSSTISVKVLNHKPETLIAADGQVEKPLKAGDEIVFCRSRHRLNLVRLKGSSFFKTLRQKLSWSGSNV